MRVKRVCFNPWIGQRKDDLQENLKRLIWHTRYPHILILNEVWDWSGTVLQYQRVEAPKLTEDKSYRSTIILVRWDGDIVRTGGRQAAGEGWVWNGHRKEMRVFPRAVVRWPDLGVTTDDIGIHRVPGGPRPQIEKNYEAWKAEDSLIVNWTDRILDRSPNKEINLGGDWNASLREEGKYSLPSLAHRINASTKGIKGIDGFMTINGAPEEVEKLDKKFGSDAHHPVVATSHLEGR